MPLNSCKHAVQSISHLVNIISKKSLSSTGKEEGTTKSRIRSQEAGVSAYLTLSSESPTAWKRKTLRKNEISVRKGEEKIALFPSNPIRQTIMSNHYRTKSRSCMTHHSPHMRRSHKLISP